MLYRNPAIDELAKIPQWVIWKPENRGAAKPTKVPYCVGGRKKASSSDPGTWDTFDACYRSAFVDGHVKNGGIGFVITKATGIIGADCDNCVDHDGNVDGEVLRWLARFNSYAEISPSGRGIRIFCRGTMPMDGLNPIGSQWEIYSAGRFLTVTGRHIEASSLAINLAQDAIDALLSVLTAGKVKPDQPDGEDRDPVDLDGLRQALTGDTPHAWHSSMLTMIAHLVAKGAEDWFILDWALQYRWQGYSIAETRRDVQKMIDGARAKGWGPSADDEYQLLCDIKPNLANHYIIKGLIDRHTFGEVHSDRSAGKTAILVDLLLHVAAGLEYRGRRVVQQPVVYVALEGHGGIDNRMFAAKHELGIFDAPFALLKAKHSFRDPEAVKKVADRAQRLMNIFGGDCPLIAIDTFTAALGAGTSDCDPKDVTKFIANVQQYLLASCTVIIAHHFGKDSSRGGRGWSGLGAALDFELEIDRDGDLRTLRITKSRDGSDRQPAFCYNLVGREIGTDEDGDPVTAVVVEHLADQAEQNRGKRHSPKARATLNVLWEMIKDRSRSFPLPDQPGLRCVVLGDWEKACIEPGAICNCSQVRDRRQRFTLAQKELLASGAIIIEGGVVYPASKHDATDRDEGAP